MPGSVSKPSLGLLRRLEERISSTPLRSLLTKKTARVYQAAACALFR
jgi:hypothetical protein